MKALGQQAISYPHLWAAPAAMLLRQFKGRLDHSLLLEWQQALASALQQPSSRLHAAKVQDVHERAAGIHLCRFARELAAAWPASFCSVVQQDSTAEADAAEAGTDLAALWTSWKVGRIYTKPCLHCISS